MAGAASQSFGCCGGDGEGRFKASGSDEPVHQSVEVRGNLEPLSHGCGPGTDDCELQGAQLDAGMSPCCFSRAWADEGASCLGSRVQQLRVASPSHTTLRTTLNPKLLDPKPF